MPKGTQTTLFQTWGYEGNKPQNKKAGGGGGRGFSDEDDPDLMRALKESMDTANIHEVGSVGERVVETVDLFDDADAIDEAELIRAAEEEELNNVERQPQAGPSRAGQYIETVDLFEVDGEEEAELARAVEETLVHKSSVRTFKSPGVDLSRPGEKRPRPLETLPGFDITAGNTWIYPTNYSFRSYQFDMVQSCLYNNTLVCLPTGLGKTFIAAVVMYNFYRWYPQGKIVFMAPTKPLVAQQIEACFNIMGIPQSDTMEMTGSVPVHRRKSGWEEKRVFFLTPQVMINDLTRGLFPARQVKLMIVDEAHKAQGEFAYCVVARELHRSQVAVRIVALSATPGNDLPSVKSMLKNLFISHIELRHEESPDVLPFTNQRKVDKIVVSMGESLQKCRNKVISVIEIYTKRLASHHAVRNGANPTYYSKFAILKARDEWRQNPPNIYNPNIKGLVEADYATCMSLYHGLDLLSQHGMRPFYNFFNKKLEDSDKSGKRIRQELNKIPVWRDVMAELAEKFSEDVSNSRLNQTRPLLTQPTQKSDEKELVASHPKLSKLIEVVREHFQKFAANKLETRVMIFSQYRDSVNELVACLAQHSPIIKPMSFVGQAGAGGKKGLTQKEQIEVVRRFREGGYNTLVATCVGEEGLDIGEVDLIVLFDVSKSPIRLVQRMGRTGRKRAGRIVVLVTEGQEERTYNSSISSKQTINKAILDKGKLATFLYPNAPRMVPRGIDPVCHKMKMIVEQFKGRPVYKGPEEGRGHGGKKRSVKLGRYDVFRQSCGFLVEEEEQRWRERCQYTGAVKKLAPVKEMWTRPYNMLELVEEEELKGSDLYNLSEYSLWQNSKQPRCLIGPGKLSTAFTSITKIIANSAEMRALVENFENNMRKSSGCSTQTLLTSASVSNIIRKTTGGKKSVKIGANLQPADTEDGAVSVQKWIAPKNSILSYFQPSQEQDESVQKPNRFSPSRAGNVTIAQDSLVSNFNLGDPQHPEMEVGNESEDSEVMIVDEVVSGQKAWARKGMTGCQGTEARVEVVARDGLSKKEMADSVEDVKFREMVKESDQERAERELLEDLFDGEGDSGFSSPVSHSSDPLEKLLANQSNKAQLELFDFRTAVLAAKTKYDRLFFSQRLLQRLDSCDPRSLPPAPHLVVMAAAVNMSGDQPPPPAADRSCHDMFADDSSIGDCDELFDAPAAENVSKETEEKKNESKEKVGEKSTKSEDYFLLSQFIIDSPEMEEPEDAGESGCTPPRKASSRANPTAAAVYPAADPTADATTAETASRLTVAHFDIGSPILLSEEDEDDPRQSSPRPLDTAVGENIPSKDVGSSGSDDHGGLESDAMESLNSPIFSKTKSQAKLQNSTQMSPELTNHGMGRLGRGSETCLKTSTPLSQRPGLVDQPRSLLHPVSQPHQVFPKELTPVRQQQLLTRVRPFPGQQQQPQQCQQQQQLGRRKLLLSDVFSREEEVVEKLAVEQDPPTGGGVGGNSARFQCGTADIESSSPRDSQSSESLLGATELVNLLITDNRPGSQRSSRSSKSSNASVGESAKQVTERPSAVSNFEFSQEWSGLSDIFSDVKSSGTNQQKQASAMLTREVVTSAGPATVVTSAGPATAVTSVGPATAVTSVGPATAVTSVGPATAVTSAGPATAVTSAGPATAVTCPICSCRVLGEINAHIDTCLSEQLLEEITNEATQADARHGPRASQSQSVMSPNLRRKSISSVSSGTDGVTPQSSSRTDGNSHQQSDEDSPVIRGRKRNRGMVIGTQADSSEGGLSFKTGDDCTMSPKISRKRKSRDWKSSSEDDDFAESPPPSSSSKPRVGKIKPKPRKKTKSGGAQFLDLEANLSGSGDSGDEEIEDNDAFDASFVDDVSQATDQAMYLRSVRSPTFRKPVGATRHLRPITDDIFSQRPESDEEDEYEEDSFVVGSEEEFEGDGFDTLDLLEQESEKTRKRGKLGGSAHAPKNKQRHRRIIAPVEDDTILESSPTRPASSGKKEERKEEVTGDLFDNDSFPESQSLLEGLDSIDFFPVRQTGRGNTSHGNSVLVGTTGTTSLYRNSTVGTAESVRKRVISSVGTSEIAKPRVESACVTTGNAQSRGESADGTSGNAQSRGESADGTSGNARSRVASAGRTAGSTLSLVESADGTTGSVQSRVASAGGTTGSSCLLHNDSVGAAGSSRPRGNPNFSGTVINKADSLNNSNLLCLQPDLSESLGKQEKPSIIVSNSEVNRSQEIISCLKNFHKVNVVIMREVDPPVFIVSLRMAVARMSETEFSLGSSRAKLVETIKGMREYYDKIGIVVEFEKVRPGERRKPMKRSKYLDRTVVLLARAKTQVYYSFNQANTASILADLIASEDQKNMGLPRPLDVTVFQEERRKWYEKACGVGAGPAVLLAKEFARPRDVVLSSVKTLRSRANLSQTRAAQLHTIFNHQYNEEDFDFIPL